MGPFETPEFLSIVDSGADISMFDTSLAIGLGVVLPNWPQGRMGGIGGVIPVYHVDIQLTIEGHTFPATVTFADRGDPTFALLGRADAFKQFKFAFDQRSEQVLYQRY